MTMTTKLRNILLALTSFLFAQVALAGPKTLIELDGGKPKAGLAKSWKKVKDGEYEFDLDTTQEVKKGTPVSADLVKASLESKLGSTMGVKVTPKGAAKVDVTYTGAEQKFLEEVAKTKIRDKNVEIALESSTSEGGIRAADGNRPAEAGEVKGSIAKIEKGMVTVKVVESKVEGVKAGDSVKVKTDAGSAKKSWKLFFKPEKKEGDAWVPKKDSVQVGK